ncbi:MAG: IS1634 family transposase [Oscillospiraceae bacterium]|nr:IS1634 family transposase [Oscillospiraceae bacterium]
MFLRQEKRKDRIYLSIVETYVEPTTKKHKTRYVEVLGYLDELEKEYDDPIAFFKAKAVKMTEEQKAGKKEKNIIINPDETLKLGEDSLKNAGYLALSAIYRELGLDRFFAQKQYKLSIGYNLNSIFRLLVYGRIIMPGSKKKTYEKKHKFFDKSNFALEDVYRSLSFFAKFSDDIQKWLYSKVSQFYKRDTSISYYDVTNYYFEIDRNDEDIKDDNGNIIKTGFRKKGVNKEHRPLPIVQMGLFMDKNGLPVSFKLFDGNTNDTLTLRPALKDARMKYGLGKVIVVADKGLNSGDNIYYLKTGKNGYVVSKSVRGGSCELKKYVLDPEGYTDYGGESGFKIKSKPIVRTIEVTKADGSGKFKHKVEEKLVVFYSEKYAKRAAHDRQNAIEKAKDMIAHPGKYTRATSYGAAKYVSGLSFVEDTGEIATGMELSFNQNALDEDEKLDGYYAIYTSEIDKSQEEILEIYRGLWRIEESFKITKSTLEARPVYVSLKDHIHAHFLICFVSLLIMRILELKVQRKHCCGEIAESLRNYNCIECGQNYYRFTYFNEVIKDLGDALDIDFSPKYRTLGEIKKIFKNPKKGS